MTIYAESSAVLAYLLGEEEGDRIGPIFDQAMIVTTSDLTLVECSRALHRAKGEDRLSQKERDDLEVGFRGLVASWSLIAIGREVIQRACEPFGGGPIRTLDALHVASALEVAELLPDCAIVSLDERVRRVSEFSGLDVLPA